MHGEGGRKVGLADAMALPSFRGPTAALVVGGLCVAVSLLAVGGYLGALTSGLHPVTPPVFVVTAAVCVPLIVVAAVGTASVSGRMAAWLTALAASLTTYVGLAAAGFTLADKGTGPLTRVVVTMEGGWFAVVLTVAALIVLVAMAELGGRPIPLRRTAVTLLVTTGAVLFLGVVASDPGAVYPGVEAPLAGLLPAAPAYAAFTAANIGWMLTCLIPPVLAWRSALDRPAEVALRRRRLLVAVGASCPPFTLLTCVLLLALTSGGLLGETGSETILSVAFCAPLVLVAGAVAAAADDRRGAAVARWAVRWVLGGLWLLVAFQLAVVVTAVLAASVRQERLLGASALGVATSVCFVAAYGPITRRLVALTHDPEPAQPEAHALLTARENDVLARLAAGLSNAAIAADLCVSERTVDSHVSAIFDKLGLDRGPESNRRVQAAAAWWEGNPTHRSIGSESG